MTYTDVGADHCRVVPPPASAAGFDLFEYLRHAFVYTEVVRRLPAGAKVLEVGSGEGYGAQTLAANGLRVVATDLSWQALRHAREFYASVPVSQALGAGLPFPASSFDAVVSFQVIEHIAQVTPYLQEIRRVLRPSGALFLTTPNRKWRLWDFEKPWNPYHVHEYFGEELRLLLQSHFQTVELLGVMARGDLLEREKQRVKPTLKRFVRLRVMAWLPTLYSFIQRRRAALPAPEPPTRMALNDFFLSPQFDAGMDFFACCQKTSQGNPG